MRWLGSSRGSKALEAICPSSSSGSFSVTYSRLALQCLIRAVANSSYQCFLLTFSLPDSIFHDPTSNILFASFKYVGYNWAGDMERMRENPKVQEWWRMTDSYQESFVEGAKSSVDGEPAWWKGLEEVFYAP